MPDYGRTPKMFPKRLHRPRICPIGLLLASKYLSMFPRTMRWARYFPSAIASEIHTEAVQSSGQIQG